MDAGRPLVRKRGGIDLQRARHPLLDQARAVPMTVALGGAFDTLVITGPNTGGKTVTLKTLGLLCLMAQCGLHIPAGDQQRRAGVRPGAGGRGRRAEHRAEPVHLLRPHGQHQWRFCRRRIEQSLILFDELGAGTDPVEGAALAIAIIQDVPAQGRAERPPPPTTRS